MGAYTWNSLHDCWELLPERSHAREQARGMKSSSLVLAENTLFEPQTPGAWSPENRCWWWRCSRGRHRRNTGRFRGFLWRWTAELRIKVKATQLTPNAKDKSSQQQQGLGSQNRRRKKRRNGREGDLRRSRSREPCRRDETKRKRASEKVRKRARVVPCHSTCTCTAASIGAAVLSTARYLRIKTALDALACSGNCQLGFCARWIGRCRDAAEATEASRAFRWPVAGGTTKA
jgi:hypothetical protein